MHEERKTPQYKKKGTQGKIKEHLGERESR
jgi:hypothetical protein